MIKLLSLGLIFLPTTVLAVEEASHTTKTYTIETNEPPKPSEEHVERTPFFAEPTAANEAQEEVEALREDVKDLKARVSALEKGGLKK